MEKLLQYPHLAHISKIILKNHVRDVNNSAFDFTLEERIYHKMTKILKPFAPFLKQYSVRLSGPAHKYSKNKHS